MFSHSTCSLITYPFRYSQLPPRILRVSDRVYFVYLLGPIYALPLLLLYTTLHQVTSFSYLAMGLLPDTQNFGLRMRREWRERFPRHLLQRKPLVSDPGMHPGTCVTHVPRCMPGSLTSGGGENLPGIPSACATHIFTYLARGPCVMHTQTHTHTHMGGVCCWFATTNSGCKV